MSRMCYNCTLYSEVHADTFPCNVCFGTDHKCNFTKRPNDIKPGRVFANVRTLQDKVLEYGDYVQFGSVLYMVQNEWLHNLHGSNGRIWEDLGLYDKRAQIMQAFLGRDDAKCNGEWPEYDLDRDAKGLTACVQWLLYRLEFLEGSGGQSCRNCVFWNFDIKQAPCKSCEGLNAFIPAYGFIRDTECDTEGDEVEAGPRTFVSPEELAGEVLRPGDVLYIQSVKYVVEGEPGGWFLVRVTPDRGRSGLLFREFDLNAWKLLYNIGLGPDSLEMDYVPSECYGWPEADTLENLTKFVHIVYALTTVYQVGHCKGQAIGRDDYKAETERKIMNAIKVLQQ